MHVVNFTSVAAQQALWHGVIALCGFWFCTGTLAGAWVVLVIQARRSNKPKQQKCAVSE